jgi:type IV pilus assembly protein PilV
LIDNGFTLLEVLVSLFILSLLLLGLDAAQTKALQSAKSVYYFNVATEQLRSIMERLQAINTPNDINALQLLWDEQNARVLPQGRGEIDNSPPLIVITIHWGNNHNCDRDQIGLSGCLRVSTKGQF